MFLGVMRWRQRSPRRPLAPRELSDAWTRECGLGVFVICNWEQAHDDWARDFDLIVNCCDGQASYKRPVSLVCSRGRGVFGKSKIQGLPVGNDESKGRGVK